MIREDPSATPHLAALVNLCYDPSRLRRNGQEIPHEAANAM